MSKKFSLNLVRPIPLLPGEKKPHAKEEEDLWIFRLLDLTPTDDPQNNEYEIIALSASGVTIKNQRTGKTETLALPQTRIAALASWIHHVREGEKDTHRKPICCVVTNQDHNQFLLQEKDDKHPTESYRHRFCPFGRSFLEHEKPIVGMIRELYEEIRDARIVDQLCFLMRCQLELQLWSPQFQTFYPCLWWVVASESQHQFNHWHEVFFNDGLGEATPAFLNAENLLSLEQREKVDPGSCFCNNQHELYLRVLHGDFRV